MEDERLQQYITNFWAKLQERYGISEDLITYLGRFFDHPVILLAVMFDTGSVISGSRALEFIVSESIHEDSDWDFYVPAFRDAIVDMIEILKICGVKWETRTEQVKNDGKTKVSSKVLNGLVTWRTKNDSESLLGKDLNSYMKTYEPKTPYEREIEKNGEDAVRQPYDWFTPSLDIMEGTIQNSKCKDIKVQLIIASSGDWDLSIFELISRFYASHVQCIIGGWYVCHMYYRKAKAKQSYEWNLNHNQKQDKVDAAIEKYRKRGYTFLPPKSRTITRRFDDKESLFIDFSKMYIKILKEEEREKYKGHLADRNDQLMRTSWKEQNGSLTPNITDRRPIRNYPDRTRTDPATREADYERLYQRLANHMATKCSVGFQSSIKKTEFKWGIPELAKSAIPQWKFKEPAPLSFSL